MKKHFPKALALFLALVMTLSVFPVMSLAVEEGAQARFLNGLPADGSYGVIYNVDGYVMGADLDNGKAPAKRAELSPDQSGIKALPNGAAVLKFIKTGSDYYLTIGGKYLTVKDLDANNKEKLVLTEAVETGSKWSIIPDKAGASGCWNFLNAEYKWNGSSDVYLEQFTSYGNSSFSPYSYNPNSSSFKASYFQMKIAATEADEDGRVGEIAIAGDLPADGGKYVVYNGAAKAVFGQPTGEDVSAPALQAAAAIRNEDGSIDYENVADGGMIFTVEVMTAGSDTCYRFENNGKYLAMPENKVVDDGEGKSHIENDETLLLIPEPEADKIGYTQWTLTQVAGGYVMYNVSARYKSSKCCVEYFNEVFSGWSYKADTPEIFAMSFVPMEDRDATGYVVNPEVVVKTPDPAIGADCPVEFEIHDVSEPTQITASYKLDNGAFQTAAHSLEVRKGSFTVPAAALEGGKKLTVRVQVTDALGKSYEHVLTVDIRDEPLLLTAFPAPNSATGEELRPEIGVTFANAGRNPAFELLLDDEAVTGAVSGDKFSYTPAADMTEGKHNVQVTLTRTDGKSASRKWMFFIGEGGETLYFGQIHAHTAEYSDGVGTLEDAYEHAAGVDDLDFIIITDHSNYFDSTATATTSSYYDLSSLTQNAAKTTTKWEEARATAAEYNARYDGFLCVYGYEMTWSGGPGHTNSFNTYGVVSRNNAELNNKTGYAGMHRYNDLMVYADRGLDVDGNEAKITRNGAEATGVNATKYIPFDAEGGDVPVVSQFNHPGKTFGNFDNYAGYTAKRDDVLNLIEVGNGEGKVGGSAYFPSYEEYDLCLAMGWHVGPTNNQDNHKGNWGDSNTCRDVILTDDFSEIGLYRALDARRIYSTEDQNLRISYELEAGGVSYKLGDIAPIDDDAQPETVTARLSVSDPDRSDKIATVEIIGEGGKSLKKLEVNAGELEQEITIPNTDGYYYIRVVEADGDIAVTAPVWVKEAVPVAADLETSVAVAAQGEEETVTATLTNGSETELLYLHGYKLEAEGRVLADESGLEGVVEPGKSEEIKLPFTPSATEPAAVKTYEITVTFQVVFKGKELTYTKTISETSYPPEMMTYIGLDKGHDNFYVSGDYAGNEGNFIDICAQRGILCKYIDKGEMTKENLARFKAVLITVPRVKGEGLPDVWTPEELEALADYAAKGGTILSFSKSDRYDPEDPADAPYAHYYSSANLSNLVNEAIGAQTRFVRGIVVDNEKKANEAYRVYFDGRELVGDHIFTQGIVPSTNGSYQWYNGTGITIDPCARFADVKRNSWYHSAVDFVLEHGLMSGTGADKFGPTVKLTREMFVTILWQLAGKPKPSIANPFTDVKESNYSYKAILWAFEQGITTGKTATTFGRKNNVTRQELAVFFYKYAASQGLPVDKLADLSAYPDAGTASGWARTALSWAVANGLISGNKVGDSLLLQPKGTANRAQVAQMLLKFAQVNELELPKADSAVTTLIAPYPSTWIANYKDNFTGSAYVPNYENDTVMAKMGSGFALATAEKLPGGGWLVCSGATFISNYDLKYGIAANEQYENYLLVCNILDYIKNGPFDGEITPIAEVHKAEVGQEFTVEGTVTANASDYDKDTAFFDCIYVQDETRGINCFPVSGYYFVGERVRVHGGVTYYCGEIELNLSNDYIGSIQVISNDVEPLEPTKVSCAEAMSDDNIGNLMKVSGVITEIHETAGVIDKIYVDDGSGEEAMFFINGYIQKESHALDEAKVGMMIEGVGIGSRDVDEENGGADGAVIVDDPSLYIKRLRVRARDELLVYEAELDTAELEAAIAEAEALDRSLYTEASLAVLDQALTAAKAVMADPNKDQRAVTEARNALRAALDGLAEKGEAWNLVPEIHDGDVVVIYNAGNQKAVKAEMSGYYMSGYDIAAENGVINKPDAAICWTVTENDDGTYTFRNGEHVLAAAKSGSYNNLYLTETDHSIKWTLVSLNSANNSYVAYAPELASNYGHVYLEWYGNKTAFSAYDTSEERATEQNFGFQFYKLAD